MAIAVEQERTEQAAAQLCRNRDTFEVSNEKSVRVALHRVGGQGLTWKGIVIQQVGMTTSCNFLQINNVRPNLRRENSVRVDDGEFAGEYLWTITKMPKSFQECLVQITWEKPKPR